MSARKYNQLVANIKRDGCMTSTPLIYKNVILSGNHRVRAAIEAGVEEDDVLELLGDITDARALAIQLSHNAIDGEDDPNILEELYDELGFSDKLYTGLIDEDFGVPDLDLASLSAGSTEYEELTMTFLPEQAEQFVELAERLSKKAPKRAHMVADLADFDDFFDTFIRAKEIAGVFNTGLLMRWMLEVVDEHLTKLEAAEAEGDDTDTDTDTPAE